MRSIFLCCLALGWALCLTATETISATEVPKTYGGRHRRTKWFHFEERPRNPYELPEHWFPIGRTARTSNPSFGRYSLHQQLMTQSGFPRYTQVRFDREFSTSGEYSFHLALNGGSAGAYLEVGAVGAVANSDYIVTAGVRTTSLNRARAQLLAYFVDSQGRKIKASEAKTPLLQTDGRWRTVSVKLLGKFENTAWIGIQIQLLQPQHDPENPLGSHQVVLEEVEGRAWFDDIAVWQLPRLVVRSQSPVNIVRHPDRPRLAMQVVDLTGRPLSIDLTLYDEHLRPVVNQKRQVGPGSPPLWRWRPPLEKFGWFLIDLQAFDMDQGLPASTEPVARTVSSLLWLGKERPMHPIDATRFGLVAEDLPDDQLDLIPEIIDMSELGSVVLSAWKRDLTLPQIDKYQSQLDDILQRILTRDRRIILSLYPMPHELAQTVDISGTSPSDLFANPMQQWRPFLAPVLMRHSQRVRDWLVAPAAGEGFFFDLQLDNMFKLILTRLGNIASNPRIVVPWNLNQTRRFEIGPNVEFLVRVPHAVLPDQLGMYLDQWKQTASSDAADVALLFDIPPATRLTHIRRINDMVLRMLHAWESGQVSMHISKPWTVSTDRCRTPLPDPLLGVFATVAHHLAGRRVVGRLSLDRGLECMILDGNAGGMLVAWNRSADEMHAKIDMFLGKTPVTIDVWGNREPVPLRNGRHQLMLGRTPIFIEGIDPKLALFRAAFQIVPPFIESKQILHQRTLTLANPWPRTISGYMIIKEPQTWVIQPPRKYFSIASGQSTAVPISLRFPISEVAGPKKLVVRFEFDGTSKYVADVSTHMELGLRDVEFDANLSLTKNVQTGKVDAIVVMLVTNTGDEVLSLRSFAHMSGYPREMKAIFGLQPRQSVARRFQFEDVAKTIHTTNIRVGLRELSGPAVLNKILSLDDQ